MSQGAILILIAVSAFCIWMATHPAPPRSRRSRRDSEQDIEDSDDPYPVRLRRKEEQERDIARIRLQAAGRNRWDRRDIHEGVGRDSTIDEPEVLIWPQKRQTLVPKLH
jgi:hypothetical protein